MRRGAGHRSNGFRRSALTNGSGNEGRVHVWRPLLQQAEIIGSLGKCIHFVNGRRALVCVEAPRFDVNVARVAATLDVQPWFHVGKPPNGYSAWHAGRVHHRCRLLFPPDTACEGVGSYLRLAWDQQQGRQSPVYMSDRAFLMQARALCLGGERDELIVEAVCRLLQTTSKYKVSAGRKVDAGMVPFARAHNKAFARSGRFSGRLPAEEASMVLEPNDFAALQGGGAAQRKTYLQKCARAAKPVELPDIAKKAVLNAISGQVVQPLPANINVLHALQRRGHKQRRTGQNRILVGFRGGY